MESQSHIKGEIFLFLHYNIDILMSKKAVYLIIIGVIICLCQNNIIAITPTWNINLGGVFDNREGSAKFSNDRTFLLMNLGAEGGLKFTNSDRIAAGAEWIQPIENGIKKAKIYPTLYYRHEGEHFKFSMGMFPLTQLKSPLPGFLWSDSLAYYQKNLRGILTQYQTEKGFIDFYLDWRGIQSKDKREAFEIVFHGERKILKSSFHFGGYAMMNHLAKTFEASEDQNVVDNFLLNPYMGVHLFKSHKDFNSIINIGPLLGIERHRNVTSWNVPIGFWMDLSFEWRFLGIKNNLYLGEKLFPMYEEFGNELYLGESFFSSNFYDRLDLIGRIYQNKYMQLDAQLNFNFSSEGFIFYQRILLDIYLGN